MNNLETAIRRTVSYLRDWLLDDGEPPTFDRIQTHLLNANVDQYENLVSYVAEGTSEERVLYAEVERLSRDLGIQLYQGWQGYHVDGLSMRQRETFGFMVESDYGWLRDSFPCDVPVTLFGVAPQRGYIFRPEGSTMLVKQTQGKDEPDISLKAARLDEVGPDVFEANPDYIVEQVVEVDNQHLRNLLESPEQVGEGIGSMFKQLHDAGILYREVFVFLPTPQFHLLTDGSRQFLIDYGDSIRSSDTGIDLVRLVVSLDFITQLGRKGLCIPEDYMDRALGSFSRVYGAEVKRSHFPNDLGEVYEYD